MPKGGSRSTFHKKQGGWEYWQFSFSSTVIIAEKRLKWYDDEKFNKIWAFCREKGVRFYWDESQSKYTRNNSCVELYMKFPSEVSFVDKVEKMKQLITEIGCF